MRNILFICAIAIGFTACEKDAGEGGTSVIEGQVYKIFTSQNPFSGEWDTSFFQLDVGKDVFIIYSTWYNEHELPKRIWIFKALSRRGLQLQRMHHPSVDRRPRLVLV